MLRVICLAVLALQVSSLIAARASQTTQPGDARAAQIARQVQERDTGRDRKSTIQMRLYDRRGRLRERVLTLLFLNNTDPQSDIGDRLLLRFTSPNDLRGTGLLVWEHRGDDERFLYLPSLGRVRRIMGAEAQESFVGSDFTYEDIGGRELDDYTYGLLGEDDVWIAPGGGRHAAYRLESRRKDRSSRYPRLVSLVLKDSFVVVRSESYNRRDEREKAYDVRRLERVEGIWTVLDATMANDLDGTRTELIVQAVDYDVGLRADDFSRRELERGAP